MTNNKVKIIHVVIQIVVNVNDEVPMKMLPALNNKPMGKEN
jgi:hypothetical protein